MSNSTEDHPNPDHPNPDHPNPDHPNPGPNPDHPNPGPSPDHNLAGWLDWCEQQLVHPDMVRDQLKRAGWNDYAADTSAFEYRRRFNEHPLGYSALLVSTGVAALALGTALHELVGGLDQPVDRNFLAFWLSVLLCALPFAGWAHQWAARMDREDVVAVWSRPRRRLAQVLLWACGLIGGGRLLVYAVGLVAYLVKAPWAADYSFAAGALNVAIAVGIALPLGLWAYRFLHRFDAEDPTAPPTQRHRVSPPATV